MVIQKIRSRRAFNLGTASTMVFCLVQLVLSPVHAEPRFAPGATTAGVATGATTDKSKTVKKQTTKIFEESSDIETQTDTIKFIREADEGTEIILQKLGVFSAPTDGTSMERIQEAFKAKLPISFTYHDSSKKILKVNPIEKPKTQ